MKRISVLILLSVFSFVHSGYAGNKTKTVTDMDDRIVQVPESPKRIACMHGVSSERIITLGQGKSLALAMAPSPWCAKLFPETKDYEYVKAPFIGNTERMLALKVDLVLYSPFPGEAEKYRAVGLKTACGFSSAKMPRTLTAFMENFTRQYRFFGELLGGDARQRADKYCRHFESRLKEILAVTSKIKSRPAVYYGGRVPGNLMTTQGKNSFLDWLVHVAGGRLVSSAIDGNFVEANLEQVISWKPDIILVSGWGGNTDSVLKNPVWSALPAVKKGRVHLIPQGVFAWEYASGESVLLAAYLAKLFHPEAFKELDMISEMKKFYSDIYGKSVSDSDVRRILKGLPPL